MSDSVKLTHDDLPAPARQWPQDVSIFLVFFAIGPFIGGIVMLAFGYAMGGHFEAGTIIIKDTMQFLAMVIVYIWPISFIVGGASAFVVAVFAWRDHRKNRTLRLPPLLAVAFVMYLAACAYIFFVPGVPHGIDNSIVAAYLFAHLAATFFSWLIAIGMLRFVFAEKIHA